MADQPRWRVLHVLASGPPRLNGYTVRSTELLRACRDAGFVDPIAVVSPFDPEALHAAEDTADLNGIAFHRVRHPAALPSVSGLGDRLARLSHRLRHAPMAAPLRERLASRDRHHDGSGGALRVAGRRWHVRPFHPLRSLAAVLLRIEERLLMRRLERVIVALARRDGIELIHAHSPYRCAIPALRAGRRLGLPVVYEVRGLWEETAVAEGLVVRGDASYRRWRRLERRALRRADVVVTLGRELERWIVATGVPRERVHLVPNAVDGSAFVLSEEAPGSEVDALLPGITCVFGYVGSLRLLEGVDALVEAVAAAVRQGRDAGLLVVGGGPDLGRLTELADSLGLGSRAVFTGQVPHYLVARYYRRIDVFTVTRPDLEVTRTVPPLKPLEAMAMGKPLLLADLPALRDLVPDGEPTVAVYYTAGDLEALAGACCRLAEDPELRRRLGAAARHRALLECSWDRNVPRVLAAYRQARAQRSGGAR